MDNIAKVKRKVEIMQQETIDLRQEVVDLQQERVQSEILAEIAIQEVKEQWTKEVNSLKKQLYENKHLHQNRMQKSRETQV